MTRRPQAAPRAGLSALVELLGLRRSRRGTSLASLDARLLRDIGLTRSEAEKLSRR